LFPAVAPDGDRIAFSSVRFGYEQVRVEVDGGGVRRHALQAAGLEWSPSGNHFAFVHGPNIVLRDAGSGWERALVTSADFEGRTWWIGDLEFSPDGARIAYARIGDEGSAVWVSPATGGLAVKIASNAREPTFSPDGASLAYSYARTGIAKGESATALTRDGGRAPKWSPGGEVIAYITDDGLRLVEARGGRGIRDLTKGSYMAIEWSSEGDALYGLRAGLRLEAVIINPGTGATETLADLGHPPAEFIFGLASGREPVRSFSTSRDGRTLEISMLRPDSDVWTLSGYADPESLLDRLLHR
jgi:Tol biopolymer transport system component